jgi:tagatose-1,6-bisphosphate aldolase
MKIAPGKQKGMKAVSDARGVIAAAAMDERHCQRKGNRQAGRVREDARGI